MILNFIEKCLKNKLWVFIFVGLFLFLGIDSLKKISLEAVPDISNIQVMINTKTGGLDPEQVEKTITYYIETEMGGIPKLKDIRSLSKFGLSQVIVIFEDGTDIYWARQIISEKLQNVREKLPEKISPELGPLSTGLGEIYMYVVLPKKGSVLEKKPEKEQLLYLKTIHTFTIAPYLKTRVKGVAEIDVNGGYTKQIHIDFYTSKMNEHGITIDDILHTLKSLGENAGAGYIEKNEQQIIVRTEGNSSINSINDLPIKLNVYGNPIRLKNVAKIREDAPQRVGSATFEGKETILGTVLMLQGSNSRNVALDVEQALKEIELPSDVYIQHVYTRSNLVNKTLHTVTKNLVESAILVIVILFLIMGNFLAAIIVSLAIPLSMIGTAIGMNYFGISANLMSLGAIDFGLLVDASVVVVESIIQKMEHRKKKVPTLSEKFSLILESMKEVKTPVITGMIIVILVYFPILTLEGVEGKMFYPMAATMIAALVTSLIVAILFIPILCFIFLKINSHSDNTTFFFRGIQKIYKPILNYITADKVSHSIIVISIALIFTILNVVLAYQIGSDFVPSLNEGDMVINVTYPTDISLKSSIIYQKKIEEEIKKFKEINTVFSRIGTPESATDPMGVYLADTFIILKPSDTWPVHFQNKPYTKSELYKSIVEKIKNIHTNLEFSETQPIAMRFNEMLEGSRADLSLRIYGKDLNKLAKLQDEALSLLKTIQGSEEVNLDVLTALREAPVMKIKIDQKKLNAYGIHLEDTNRAIQTALVGEKVGSFYDYDWRFPIIFRMAEEESSSLENIYNIPLALPEPGSIPLRTVAEIKEENDVTVISRGNNRRYAGIAVNVSNRDLLSFVEEAKEKTKSLNLDGNDGYKLEWGGQFKNLERAKKKFMLLIPLTLIFIFLLLYQNFHSLKNSLLVFIGIPFSTTGGILAIYLRDIRFTVSTYIGFIILFGIAILNGMVLVTFINQLIKKGIPLKEAVYDGSLIRLRPVIMTAMVALLGFMPMALNTGIGAEVQRPLATVVIGGIISSTILTLVLLPLMYIWMGKSED